MNIQWYPGHMARARRELTDSMKLVDVVIETLDARIPRASRNGDIDAVFAAKKRLLLLNKADLASAEITDKWLEYYKQQGYSALAVNAKIPQDIKRVIGTVNRLAGDKIESKKQKGINATVRAMIVGIPNSGKSTFINAAAGQAKTKTEDRPGVTRGKQWVRAAAYLELLDTPGILPPRITDERAALVLAFTGAVRDDILDGQTLILRFLEYMTRYHPKALDDRYGIRADGCGGADEILSAICVKRGFIMSGGVTDTVRGAAVILDEFRAGRLGRISLETPEDDEVL